jgi:hydroxypyruvate reductase 2
MVVTHTPDVLNDDVANMAVLMLLACSRRFCEWHSFARSGQWKDLGDPPLARAVSGRKVGILGLGRIGQDIARKLGVFGCEIVYHGRRKQDDQPYPYYDDLTAMARDVDFLIAICPGGRPPAASSMPACLKHWVLKAPSSISRAARCMTRTH